MKLIRNTINNNSAILAFQNTDKMGAMDSFILAHVQALNIIHTLVISGSKVNRIQFSLEKYNAVIFIAALNIKNENFWAKELDLFVKNELTKTVGTISEAQELKYLVEPVNIIEIKVTFDKISAEFN